MRPLRLVAAVATLAVTVPLVGTEAGADATSFPTLVEGIVTGDLEEYQWMRPAVNADAALTEATGAGVTVAVIDTGVDASHPDLEGQVVPGAALRRDLVTGVPELVPTATIAGTSKDWFGHGTHVAGIIAGDDDGNGVTGIAPGAKIMPIHIQPMWANFGYLRFLAVVTESIDYAVAHDADVINLSLGVMASGIAPSDKTQNRLDAIDALCDSVSSADAAGVVVVASAGNDGVYGNPGQVPAICDETFTVAAMNPAQQRTWWSSYDAAVDVLAPGEDILSADSTVADASPTPHIQMSGTSMASPLVAGVVALVREQHPGWTSEQVKDQITTTAHDVGVPGRDPNHGWGVVDVAAAVGAVAPDPEPQNFMATWVVDAIGAENGEVEVSWTTPAVDAVTGYTVTVYSAATSTDYPLDGDTVRALVVLPEDGWYTVTAHTTSGDVTTYPATRFSGSGADPDRLTGTSLERKGDTLTIRWDRPEDRDEIDRIHIIATPEKPKQGDFKRVKVDPDEPFPKSVTMELSRSARWYDVRVELLLENLVDGETVGMTYMRVPQRSRALYGVRVQSVDRAGSRLVEVTGGFSPLNLKRHCGRSRCSGEEATLIVDRGRSNQRLNVVFTSQGEFHRLVRVDRGTKAIKLRIEGPKRLDSGPFRRFSLSRR